MLGSLVLIPSAGARRGDLELSVGLQRATSSLCHPFTMGPVASREEADDEEEDNGLGLAAPEVPMVSIQSV